jgi:hypothetical protein
MKIEQVYEQDDKSVKISGTLSEQEHALVLTCGLNLLYAQGLLSQLLPDIDVQEEDSLSEEGPEDGESVN